MLLDHRRCSTVLVVLDWRLGVGMVVYLGIGAALLVSLRHRAVSESSDEMGALARLYGGIEERLTAIEDLRSNGAEVHAMWRFVEDSSAALRQLGAPRAGLPADVVGGAACRSPSARCCRSSLSRAARRAAA